MKEGQNKNEAAARRRKRYDAVMFISTPKTSGWWKVWLLVILMLLLLGGATYLLFFSNYFKIKEYIVEGASDEVSQKIKEMASWETDYMILFDENNFAKSVNDKWNDFAEVEVEKKWPKTLRIVLVPELPKLIWNSQGKLYLLNASGIALGDISEEDRLKKYNDLPVVGDLSGLAVEKGKKIVSRNFVGFIESIKTNIMNSIGKEIEAFEVKETTFMLQVRMKEGYEVYFDTLRDPIAQVEKLSIFLKNGTLVDKYVDLRVPGMVYYQ